MDSTVRKKDYDKMMLELLINVNKELIDELNAVKKRVASLERYRNRSRDDMK
jgi:hypothetical protein